MEYNETDDLIDDRNEENEEPALSPDMPEIESEDLEAWPEDLELDELSKKAKTPTHFSLKTRRAIEQHLEQRSLRKQVDYLLDDHFIEEDGEGNQD